MSRPVDAVPAAFQVPFTWLDGELVPTASATVPVMTHTLHYGVGAFEGIRAYDGDQGPAVFRLREHIERLIRSAAMLYVTIPFDVSALMAACVATLQANRLRDGYVRPVVFIDDGSRGLGAMHNRTRVAVVTWPWGRLLGDDGVQRGIRAQVSATTRMNARSFLPKGKVNGQYVNSILAKRAAVHAGYEEAILLDDDGNVAEATGENLFVVKDGVLLTPPLSLPILAGITRASILDLAQDLGLPCAERSFGRDTLLVADEVFLTGTAAEVTPVRGIDGHVIGSGTRGPVTTKLQARYLDAVHGRVPERQAWLT
ncbi:MAG: branched-chain amino acid transaminase, partial [Planctomycetes bacterium]|nr:branched-chain amino acid transaminase [Planctomycetota bacterium]